MALFAGTVVWACLGKIDIVAVAVGKIIPSDRVKTIQPLEMGVITAIHVQEGQAVAKGDPLVTLDATQTAADEKRLDEDLRIARAAWLRAKAFHYLLGAPPDMASFSALDAVQRAALELQLSMSPDELVLQASVLDYRQNEYRARCSSLESQQRAREGELRQAQSLQRKIQRTLPIIAERADSITSLYRRGLMSREQHLALEQERIGQEQDLMAESARVDELKGEVEAVAQQITALRSQYRTENLMALIEARQKTGSLEQELIKARRRSSQQRLVAPITGTVQQLAIHTIAGVVTPAQALMVIVPQQGNLEVEAFVRNQDIGFVQEGQAVEVKIDTFNFTKYGTIDAELRAISNDAVADERLGLVYPVRVLLDTAVIKVRDKWVQLSPGMSVTVEVKTGKRRIIEYFLSPLLRYKHESIRER
jgi:hemolysin D